MLSSAKVKFLFTNIKRLQLYYPKKRVQPQFFPLRPRQHPKNLLSTRVTILEPKKADKFINDPQTLPKPLFVSPFRLNNFKAELNQDQIVTQNFFLKDKPKLESPKEQKFLSVVILGAPNAGKSTLMNTLIGSEVSAVSNKQNTTAEALTGVHTNYDQRIQIEYIDTPGITKRHKYSKYFISKAWDQIQNTDMILFTIDGVKTLEDSVKEALKRMNGIKKQEKVDRYDEQQLQKLVEDGRPLQESQFPKILVVNKMDLCFNKKKLRWLLTELEDLAKFDKTFFVSSLTGYGIDELKQFLYSNTLDTEWKYTNEVTTNLHPIEQIQQIIRQAIFKRFYHEIPYQISIQITEFRVANNGTGKFSIVLGAQTTNQAKMLVGNKGRNLKFMQNEIQLQIAKTFNKEIIIFFEVLVRSGDYQKYIDQSYENEYIQLINTSDDPQAQLNQQVDSLRQRRQNIAKAFESFIKM